MKKNLLFKQVFSASSISPYLLQKRLAQVINFEKTTEETKN